MTDTFRSAPASQGVLDFFRHHGVWAPGVRLFRRIDFKTKASLISAVLTIPIVFLSWQFYVTGQRARDTAEHELAGVQMLQDTDALQAALRAERQAVLSGARARPELGAIDAAVARVDADAARLGLAAGAKALAEAHKALKAAPAPVDEQTLQAVVDAAASLANDIEDGSGLARDPEVDSYYLQSIVDDVVPEVVESLSHAQALAAQYHAKKAAPEGPAAHQLFAMTYWAARHLVHVEAMLERVKSVDPAGAARVHVKEATEKVWNFAAGADAAWFGDKFEGASPELEAASAQAMKAMQDVRDEARAVLVDDLHERVRRIDRQRYVAAGVLLAALGMSAYLFYAFFLVISGGLGEVRRHLVAMTQGDLTTSPRPWGRDEAAHLMITMKEMQESLRSIVTRVRSSSEGIVGASREIAAASGDLSSRTEETAAQLEKSASSMEQVAGTVRQTADNSHQAADVARANARDAEQGGQVIAQVVSTMQEIHTSSRQIGDIIGTIDGIAFQTNILALNAAVEAARAGEQGRGFAVVAGEVRNLAQRSAVAAREIKSLIGASLEKVESGTRVVQGAGETMRSLVVNANRINQLLDEISSASAEQSGGVAHVSEAVQELDRATQQNAALVEQTAAAASSLKDRAAEMAGDVSRFRLPELAGA